MGAATSTRSYRLVQHVMGTVVTFEIYPGPITSAAEVAERLSRACRLVKRADTVFSTWRADSPMSQVRRGELLVTDAPPEIATVLTLCADARRQTHGLFDPWAMAGGVDPTGLVKGWAAQAALAELHSGGMTGAMVNAAGDIAAAGGPTPDAAFRIGVVDPHAPARLACVVELRGAIATSGTYERVDHLIDPRSGHPVSSGAASASVTGPDLAVADALATALAVVGADGLDLVRPLAGYEALVIDHDTSVYCTESFPFAPDDSTRGSSADFAPRSQIPVLA